MKLLLVLIQRLGQEVTVVFVPANLCVSWGTKLVPIQMRGYCRALQFLAEGTISCGSCGTSHCLLWAQLFVERGRCWLWHCLSPKCPELAGYTWSVFLVLLLPD